MLKKVKKKLEKFISHTAFNFFISLIIVISLILLCLEKIIDFPPYTYYLLEKIDFIIVIIFTVEFVVKLILWGIPYLLKDYGWVDFLSILPIFSPALKSIRVIKSIRSIRLLRVVRILKISNYYKYSPLKQKVFVPASTLVMIAILVTGF